MEILIILIAICLLFAAFRQQKITKKLDQLEKIVEEDVKK